MSSSTQFAEFTSQGLVVLQTKKGVIGWISHAEARQHVSSSALVNAQFCAASLCSLSMRSCPDDFHLLACERLHTQQRPCRVEGLAVVRRHLGDDRGLLERVGINVGCELFAGDLLRGVRVKADAEVEVAVRQRGEFAVARLALAAGLCVVQVADDRVDVALAGRGEVRCELALALSRDTELDALLVERLEVLRRV